MLRKITGRLAKRRDRKHVLNSIRHVSGPKRFDLAEDEIVQICVGRNMAFYLPEYFRYHQALGIKRFLYIDNGSTDASVEIAAAQPDTLVASCSASFKEYQVFIREASIHHFIRGGWRLVVDADELFDYLGSAQTPPEALCAMLNEQGKTAVVAQMLDMIPNGGLAAIDNTDYPAAIQSCDYYDLSGIEKTAYHDPDSTIAYYLAQNQLSSQEIKLHIGGIRRILFGEDCLLSKHPLFKPTPGAYVGHPHVSAQLRVADMTAVLYHYKFCGGFVDREQRMLAENRIAHRETQARMNRMTDEPELMFRQDTSRPFSGIETLFDEEFLIASEQMRKSLGCSRSAAIRPNPATAPTRPGCGTKRTR